MTPNNTNFKTSDNIGTHTEWRIRYQVIDLETDQPRVVNRYFDNKDEYSMALASLQKYPSHYRNVIGLSRKVRYEQWN